MASKRYQIERNASCPCGSGIKFKRCCQLFLNTEIRNRAHGLLKAGDYTQAVIAYRAFMTQYKIWHEEHTVSFFKAKPVDADDLMIIDIEAVISGYNSLSDCLRIAGRADEVDEVLQRATNFIEDRRYLFCLFALRASHLAIINKFDSAKILLRNAPDLPFDTLSNFKTGMTSLRIYLYFIWTVIPLERCLKIIDYLISKDVDRLYRIEDLTHKGLILFVYKDKSSSLDSIRKALEVSAEISPKTEKEQLHLHVSIGRAHELIGFIDMDESESRKAIAEYERALILIRDTEAIARINQSIGQAYDYIREFAPAEKHLQIAADLAPNDYILMDLSRIRALMGKLDESMECLSKVGKKDLDDNYLIDYYSIIAQVAIEKGDKVLAKETEFNLSQITIDLPILNDLKNEIRFSLMKMLTEQKKVAPFLYKTRKAVNRIFLLQPNFFGLGLNLNNLIEPSETFEDRKGI
jgi:tetratricopeptide (TPR) repeat protein